MENIPRRGHLHGLLSRARATASQVNRTEVWSITIGGIRTSAGAEPAEKSGAVVGDSTLSQRHLSIAAARVLQIEATASCWRAKTLVASPLHLRFRRLTNGVRRIDISQQIFPPTGKSEARADIEDNLLVLAVEAKVGC